MSTVPSLLGTVMTTVTAGSSPRHERNGRGLGPPTPTVEPMGVSTTPGSARPVGGQDAGELRHPDPQPLHGGCDVGCQLGADTLQAGNQATDHRGARVLQPGNVNKGNGLAVDDKTDVRTLQGKTERSEQPADGELGRCRGRKLPVGERVHVRQGYQR